MGYDMHWVEKDPDEAALVAERMRAFNAACTVRNALPEGSSGRFIGHELAKARGLGWDDHAAYEDRTPEFITAQDAVEAALTAVDDARTSYFRLNIWGMGRFVRAMWDLGMMFDAGGHPAWPKREEYGLSDEEYDAYENEDWYREHPEHRPGGADGAKAVERAGAREAYQRHEKAQNAVLRWHGDGAGIPDHKFGTNDGWVVTPEECRQALDAYLRVLDDGNDGDRVGAVLAKNGVENRGYWERWIAYLNSAITHGGFEVH